MKDRFKFRFWITYFDDDTNKNESVMQYSDNLDSENSGSYLFYNDEDVVIQQCTGLKDKNGKLIYEGDILELDDGDDWVVGYGIVVFTRYGMGYITKGDYKYFIEDKITYDDINFIDGRIEKIIGNIYENKELLEVK